MVNEFDSLEIKNIIKPKIAVVGEIFLKYNSLANNNIIGILEKEGAEVIIPDLMYFYYIAPIIRNLNMRSQAET